MIGDGVDSVGGSFVRKLREHVGRGRVSGHSTKYDTAASLSAEVLRKIENSLQEGRSTESVGAVNTTGELTTGEQSGDCFLVRIVHSRVRTDFKTTHGVVKNGSLISAYATPDADELTIKATWYKSSIFHSELWKNFFLKGSLPGFLA